MTTAVRFSLPLNFMDPQKTDTGEIWARKKFQAIIQERLYISKKTSTSYKDTENITPFERDILVNNLVEEDDRNRRLLENAKSKK